MVVMARLGARENASVEGFAAWRLAAGGAVVRCEHGVRGNLAIDPPASSAMRIVCFARHGNLRDGRDGCDWYSRRRCSASTP